jgi:hypothetical protein
MPAASAAGGTTSGDISRPLEPAPANDWRSELSEEEEQYAEEQYTRAPRNYEKPRTITSLFVII